MDASTVHTVPGRDLTLANGDFRTSVDGYRLPLVSWSMRIDAAYCDCCGNQISEPMTVRWLHGLNDADVDQLLKVETQDETCVIDFEDKKP
ncbi:hypothetical protein [Natrinema salinisoli]|uniref:hypothetical protein n=1 Tax=Natrinema salinisoli TaxID=2878535 RepID=UPI001CF06AB1|nr:hypothetical protein [Natrinema salinisoli]